ncbi:MAG: hypothetical protein BWY59_01306 [Verrucomicrobia bacterium ADurb.Bin345]|nr:MAG: hypothetical protein BWY59_01306 [Verrucomicrobia bacterium ADurb.Bin345]
MRLPPWNSSRTDASHRFIAVLRCAGRSGFHPDPRASRRGPLPPSPLVSPASQGTAVAAPADPLSRVDRGVDVAADARGPGRAVLRTLHAAIPVPPGACPREPRRGAEGLGGDGVLRARAAYARCGATHRGPAARTVPSNAGKTDETARYRPLHGECRGQPGFRFRRGGARRQRDPGACPRAGLRPGCHCDKRARRTAAGGGPADRSGAGRGGQRGVDGTRGHLLPAAESGL